jgi:hypothetical protein
MEQIPREVEAAVRAAANTTGGYAGGLDDVYRRARRRRARRTTVVAAGAATVLALVGVGLAVRPSAPQRQTTLTPPPASSSAPAAAPAQRLILTGAIGTYQVENAAATKLGSDRRIGELLPDGRIATHPVVGDDSWDRFIGLADGRVVALGPHDTMPGVQRQDGPDVTGLEINLVVTDAGGAIQVKRDVRRVGEGVAMLTADSTTAYLWRKAGLVAHDLGSGTERVLATPKALGVPGVLDGSIQAADLVGHRLVLARAAAPCTLPVLDTGDNRTVGQIRLASLGCTYVSAVRISPGGDRVAVTYDTAGGALGTRLAVVSTADGAVLADQKIDMTERGPKAKRVDQMIVDLAWQDDRVLRGAVVPIGEGTQQLAAFQISTG